MNIFERRKNGKRSC